MKLKEAISLSGKTAIITGAASGIGLATAQRFKEAGANLCLLDIAEKILLPKQADNVKIYTIDLAVKKEIDKFWQELTGEIPEVLINNAGIYPFQDYLSVSEKDLQKILAINQNSVFWMCQNFIKRRGKKGGIIINLSSIEALLPFKEDLIPYSLSKAGVIALTRSLARDYGKKGFRSNLILPGAIKTPGTANAIRKAVLGLNLSLAKTGYNFNQRLSLGRWGEPDEIAKVVLFLASDLASYINGAMIPVDGGFLSS